MTKSSVKTKTKQKGFSLSIGTGLPKMEERLKLGMDCEIIFMPDSTCAYNFIRTHIRTVAHTYTHKHTYTRFRTLEYFPLSLSSFHGVSNSLSTATISLRLSIKLSQIFFIIS